MDSLIISIDNLTILHRELNSNLERLKNKDELTRFEKIRLKRLKNLNIGTENFKFEFVKHVPNEFEFVNNYLSVSVPGYLYFRIKIKKKQVYKILKSFKLDYKKKDKFIVAVPEPKWYDLCYILKMYSNQS